MNWIHIIYIVGGIIIGLCILFFVIQGYRRRMKQVEQERRSRQHPDKFNVNVEVTRHPADSSSAGTVPYPEAPGVTKSMKQDLLNSRTRRKELLTMAGLGEVVSPQGVMVRWYKEAEKNPVRGTIATGRLVAVTEVDGRRAKIEFPMEGWVSTATQGGETLIAKHPCPEKYQDGAGRCRVVGPEGALVRSAEPTTSHEICKLKQHEVVTVLHCIGTRAYIIKPVRGWVSLRSKHGNKPIIVKDEDDEDIDDDEDAEVLHAPSFQIENGKAVALKDENPAQDGAASPAPPHGNGRGNGLPISEPEDDGDAGAAAAAPPPNAGDPGTEAAIL